MKKATKDAAKRQKMVAKWEAVLGQFTEKVAEQQVIESAFRVTAWTNGAGIYGIRISTRDRKKYFQKSWKQIEVELDGKMHRFRLTAAFWNRCPEFRDRRGTVIRAWLKRHHTINWGHRQPPRVKLLPLEKGRFRLLA